MAKQRKPRVIPEQDTRIIGIICLCQLTLVLSGVALVYLSVAIYAPSHRAFKSGFEPEPVMCETVNTTMANNHCGWASCGEWCLTKTSGFCPQMHVAVRNNGSNLLLNNCSSVRAVSCPPAQLDALVKENCNNASECTAMRGIFSCKLGHCANYTQLLQCNNHGEGPSIDVDKDSGKLTGLYECYGAKCSKIKKPLECERKCKSISLNDANVLVSRDNTVYLGNCDSAVVSPPRKKPHVHLWTPSDGFLLVSCHSVKVEGESIIGVDCVNGTKVMNIKERYNSLMNFTQLRKLWESEMANITEERSHFITNEGDNFLPPSQILAVFNSSSRLYINLAGCVNTLRGECKKFLEEYGEDGRNFTARSRFPCYYKKEDKFSVLARFDLEQTWRDLLVAIIVPAILFVISLTTLCIITKSVKVGDDAKLRCLSCCCREKHPETSTPT